MPVEYKGKMRKVCGECTHRNKETGMCKAPVPSWIYDYMQGWEDQLEDLPQVAERAMYGDGCPCYKEAVDPIIAEIADDLDTTPEDLIQYAHESVDAPEQSGECARCGELTIELDKLYKQAREDASLIEGLDSAVQRGGTELGKFPWVRTNPCGQPIGLFEGTGIECAECHELLDELWCPRCNIGLSLPCPDCSTQAVTSHKADKPGAYYCLRCDKEFYVSVPNIIPTVIITCGEQDKPDRHFAPGFPLTCSFCGSADSFVVVGPGVCICQDCAQRATKGKECGVPVHDIKRKDEDA